MFFPAVIAIPAVYYYIRIAQTEQTLLGGLAKWLDDLYRIDIVGELSEDGCLIR
ncbi:hypothetical protein ES703_70851 [subsurface metagenome]